MIATSSKQNDDHEENHDMLIESEHWNYIVGLLSQVHQKEAKVAKLVHQLENAVVDVRKVNRQIRNYMMVIYPEFYDDIMMTDQQEESVKSVKSAKKEMRKKLTLYMNEEGNIGRYTEIAKKRPKFLSEISNVALESTEYKISLSKAINSVIKGRVSTLALTRNN